MARRKIYHTEEEREAARKEYRKRSQAKTKNITIDADLVQMIANAQDALEGELGFRPTQSQLLRFLLKKVVVR